MATAAIAAPVPGQPALPVRNRGLLTVGVMMAMIMQILDTTIANVALPHMQTSLGATMDTVTWVLTSYLVASAIALPITGWLAERLGSRNLFLIAVGGFIIASMLCGIATNLPEMVLFRVAQGMFAAFIAPLSQTVMLDINPPEHQARAMAVWGMGVMVGPIMGPVIGGWLTESYNWRWCFYVNLPVGIATFAILWFLLPSREKRQRRFDLFGLGMLALGVASLQLMLDRGQGEDWFSSSEIVVYALVSAISLWVAGVHLATARTPLFDRTLFANRNLVTAMLFMIVVGIVTMAPMALLPPMLQSLFGYPVIDTGLLLAPRGVGVLITMAISGQLMQRGFDPRVLIATGMAICALSLWQMSHWSLEMDWHPVVWSGVIQGLGMGLVFMPLNATAFATLSQQWRTDGASLLNLFRSIGASVGISLVTTLLARNLQTSHADLAQHVRIFDLPAINLALLKTMGPIGDAAPAIIDAEVNRQALMIAYLDNFYAMMWLTLAAMPLILFLKRPGKVEIVHSE